MVIDDTMMDRFIVSRVIRNCGFAEQVLEIESATEALEYLQAGSNIPQIIFLDINMPVLNGFDFLECFEQLPESTRSLVKIHMLTSSMFPGDREKAYSFTSVSGFIVKPLTAEKLPA